MCSPIERAAAVQKVKQLTDRGIAVGCACRRAGISQAAYDRWSKRFQEAGLNGLADRPRSGRPPVIVPTPAEAVYIRQVFLRSNLRRGAGSMTLAARWAAKNPESPLRPETRAAILAPRASKHALPVEIRRACRASRAEVQRYRDPKSGLNDGLYTPGWLRMATDGTRRLVPGERWVGDDATVNVGVCVPWSRGGDPCADRYGCRLGRFQVLAWLDCATDLFTGYSFVMRMTDAYGAADVVSSFYRVCGLAGYAPNEAVLEGGAWQAAQLLRFLEAAGVHKISAKGRPNQKLIEPAFGALWTVMSVELPPRGQLGRFRGEMVRENKHWIDCRAGRVDPRRHFPELPEFIGALDRSLAYRNAEIRESKEYGQWIPSEAYGSQAVKGHALPSGLRRYALPVQAERTLRRNGMVAVSAECPFGWPHTYAFAADDAYGFAGARVRVAFDPAAIEAGAVLELAAPWRDRPAGLVIAESAACISPAPILMRQAGGLWGVGALDARADVRTLKRASRALVGAQVAAFDERGVRNAEPGTRNAEHGNATGGNGENGGASAASPAPIDWEAMERAAGLVAS